MTHVKALIFDIDGTILNSQGTMTESTYQALKECHRKGYIICVATARPRRLVFRKSDIPWEQGFLLERGIFYNGGTIFDTRYHFYQHTPIPGPLLHRAVDHILQYDSELQIALQHDNEYHAFNIPMPPEQLARWGFLPTEIMDFQSACDRPVTKAVIFSGTNIFASTTDLSPLCQSLLEQFSDSLNIVLADSRKTIYLLSRHVSKGRGVLTLISFYGIKPEEVAVFGDDTPDIGMFGIFGYSIAMGNAHDNLKQKATFITGSNDEDGIVTALRDYLKIL